jgi:hypothetical protein
MEIVPWSASGQVSLAGGAITDDPVPPRKPSVPTQPNRAEREALAKEKKERGVDQYSNQERDFLEGMDRKLDRAFGIIEDKMEYFIHDVQTRSNKVAKYRRKFQRTERAAEVAAQQVVEHCGTFQQAQAHQRKYALHVLDDRAFMRPANMKAKMAYLTMGRSKGGTDDGAERPASAPSLAGTAATATMSSRAGGMGMDECASRGSLHSRSPRPPRLERSALFGPAQGGSSARGADHSPLSARTAAAAIAPEGDASDSSLARLSAAMQTMRAMSVRTAEVPSPTPPTLRPPVSRRHPALISPCLIAFIRLAHLLTTREQVTQDLIAFSTAREGSRSPPRPLVLVDLHAPPPGGSAAPRSSLKTNTSVHGLDTTAATTSQRTPSAGRALFAPVAPTGSAVAVAAAETPIRPTPRTVSFSLDEGRSAEETFASHALVPVPVPVAVPVAPASAPPLHGSVLDGPPPMTTTTTRLALGGVASPRQSPRHARGAKKGSESNLDALVEEPDAAASVTAASAAAAALSAARQEVPEVCRLEMEMVRRKARRTLRDAQLEQVRRHACIPPPCPSVAGPLTLLASLRSVFFAGGRTPVVRRRGLPTPRGGEQQQRRRRRRRRCLHWRRHWQ